MLQQPRWQNEILNVVSICLRNFGLIEVTSCDSAETAAGLGFTQAELKTLELDDGDQDDEFIRRIFAERMEECVLFLCLVVGISDSGSRGRFQVDARITHLPSCRLLSSLQNLKSHPFEYYNIHFGVVHQYFEAKRTFPIFINEAFTEEEWNKSSPELMSAYESDLNPVIFWLRQISDPRQVLLEKFPSFDLNYLQNLYLPPYRLKLLERRSAVIFFEASDFILGKAAGVKDFVRAPCGLALNDENLPENPPSESWKYNQLNRPFVIKVGNILD